jgi:hypothetical protein
MLTFWKNREAGYTTDQHPLAPPVGPKPKSVFHDLVAQASPDVAAAVVAFMVEWAKLSYGENAEFQTVYDNLLRKYALDRIRALNKLVANRGKGKNKDEIAGGKQGKRKARDLAAPAVVLPDDVKEALKEVAVFLSDWVILVGKSPTTTSKAFVKQEYVSENKDKLMRSMIRTLLPSHFSKIHPAKTRVLARPHYTSYNSNLLAPSGYSVSPPFFPSASMMSHMQPMAPHMSFPAQAPRLIIRSTNAIVNPSHVLAARPAQLLPGASLMPIPTSWSGYADPAQTVVPSRRDPSSITNPPSQGASVHSDTVPISHDTTDAAEALLALGTCTAFILCNFLHTIKFSNTLWPVCSF